MSPPPDPSALAEQVAGARWYGGKQAAIAHLEEEDVLELDGGGAVRVLAVTGADGTFDRYLWIDDEARVAPPLVQALAEGRTLPGRRAPFRFLPGAALRGLIPPGGDQRRLTEDQTNTSIVLGERLVLKLFRRIEAGEHPEIELGRHLTEHEHVAFAPAFAGAVLWGDHALAMAQAYVPRAEGGWQWAVECVLAGESAPFAALGAQTASLHAALRRMGTREATPAELHEWRAAADLQLDRALGAVGGAEGEELRGYVPRIRSELTGLEHPGAPPVLARVHGDYHVGQILRSEEGLRVVDFEGEPGRPLAERRLPGTQLRDVAAMLRSFDHLGRYVERDVRPGHLAEVEEWIEGAREAFLEAYGRCDAVLLRALEVEKETYEYVYAATFMPDWTYAAAGGMRWLMRDAA